MLQPGNPMAKVLMATLIFEAITIGLAVPVMVMVSGVSPPIAALGGGGAAVLALAAAGTIRRPHVGYPLGWATQLAALALSFLTIGMLIMGAVFATLWTVSFILGRRLEAQRETA